MSNRNMSNKRCQCRCTTCA